MYVFLCINANDMRRILLLCRSYYSYAISFNRDYMPREGGREERIHTVVYGEVFSVMIVLYQLGKLRDIILSQISY